MTGKECVPGEFYDTPGIYTYLYIIARHYKPSRPPKAPALNLKPGPISECGLKCAIVAQAHRRTERP